MYIEGIVIPIKVVCNEVVDVNTPIFGPVYAPVISVRTGTEPTVNVILFQLLTLFGSKPAGIVATPHVNLCDPRVAAQVVWIGTVSGVPTGPG